ncbi:ABC transporter permease [Bacillus mojavensis]|uniref:ABC transporter permease n=1 Tax=Bacillus mojavensis TaxID=72360 RepID=A0ABX6M2C6_BACMO|nr:ABC transporter permease [Bacillus mojavensis]
MYLFDMINVWRQNKWPWIIWIVINIFLLFLIVSSLQMININSVWESIMGNKVFSLPFPYFFICGFYLLLNGNYLYYQRSNMISLTLTRFLSRERWLLGKLLYTILLCCSYCLLLILLVHIAVFLKHGSFHYNNATIYTFFTVFLTFVICGICQSVLILRVKPIFSFIIIYGLLILPVWVNIPFPGRYSFVTYAYQMHMHYVHNNYLLFFSLIIIVWVFLAIRRIGRQNFF